MILVLYLVLATVLLGTGIRALAGHGFALTLFRRYRGKHARLLGALCVVLALALVVPLALDPGLAIRLWEESRL